MTYNFVNLYDETKYYKNLDFYSGNITDYLPAEQVNTNRSCRGVFEDFEKDDTL